jgi:hypothetical protein
MHGAGKPSDEIAYGSRAPHCTNLGASSYTLVPAPSVQVEDALRENIKRRAAKKGVEL